MAIYHFEAKVITRGTGRSVVAAAAYASCSQIYNEYDGIQHDYAKKSAAYENCFSKILLFSYTALKNEIFIFHIKRIHAFVLVHNSCHRFCAETVIFLF